MKALIEKLRNDLQFRASRSSGPGGQSVNKVSTKIELIFDVETNETLTEFQKLRIVEIWKNRISKDGLLTLKCDETRSQAKNKEIVIDRFIALIETALKPVKPRKKTKPTRSSKEKRLKEKKKISDKKGLRKIKPED